METITGTGDRRRLTLWAFPILSGILLAAAFPPLPVGFLAYLGLIPLLLSAERLQGKSAYGAGFLQGLVFYGASLYWIAWITPMGAVGAILYMSAFRGLTVLALSAVIRRFGALGMWAAPLLIVAFEYFNSLGDMGFPWLVLGNSQTAYLPLIQYASATGVYGVSFWVVLVNVTGLCVLRRRVPVLAGVAALACLFALPAVQGFWVLSQARVEETTSVAVVQPDTPPVAKETRGFNYNYDILAPLTAEAVEKGARMVIWPETAVPAYLQGEFHRPYRNRIQALADSLDAFIYTGTWHIEDGSPARSYNASVLFSPGREKLPQYNKMKLVPFGERAPFPEILPFLRQIQFSGGGFVSANFEAGTDYTIFNGPDGSFAGLICFDSVFPGLAREFVARGAQLLVVITNDAWFGRTSGPFQHAEAAVFRAIENRRAVARCANTGVSSLIDPYGHKIRQTAIFHQAVLQAELPLRTDLTFYTRYGDVFSLLCLAASALLALAAVRGRATAQPGPAAESPEAPDAQVQARPAPGAVPNSPDPASAGVPGTPAPAPGAPGSILPPSLGLAGLGQTMPFLDHLEELRWRILKGLAGVVVGAIVCAIYSDTILGVLTSPIRDIEPRPALIYLKPMGMFLVKLNIALVGGIVLALPLLLHQVWMFVAPGLMRNEQHYVVFTILSSSVCFVLGGTVAYLGVIPLALGFLTEMSVGTDVAAQFDIGYYIGFVLRLLVAFGAVFELPVLSFFLARVGVVTSSLMRRGRRYAVVVGFVLAALLTPPDPISQMMMALPLVLLYEISIWVARWAEPGPRPRAENP